MRRFLSIDTSCMDSITISNIKTLCSLYEITPNMLADIALNEYIQNHICSNRVKPDEGFETFIYVGGFFINSKIADWHKEYKDYHSKEFRSWSDYCHDLFVSDFQYNMEDQIEY